MCGRASVVSSLETYEKCFNAAFAKAEQFTENVNIGVGQNIPVITNRNPNHIQMFQLGFTPSWAHKQTYMLNARAEGSLNPENKPNYRGRLGIFNKPMFKKAIQSQRCLILVDGVIEGTRYEKLNKPSLVYNNQKSDPFAIGGIYDEWVNPLTNEVTRSVAIVTTAANDLMHKIDHHRAPVILSKKQEEIWLDDTASLQDLCKLMRPFKSTGFNAHPISQKIKNIKNRSLELLAPTGDSIYQDFGRNIYNRLKYSNPQLGIINEQRFTAGDQFALF
ncbi:MAG: SOS response-associated peptidase [Nonlabens sp.]